MFFQIYRMCIGAATETSKTTGWAKGHFDGSLDGERISYNQAQ
jgi:hypothetical protein